ncbi:hypothetical protein TNCT_472811 [Trichonephila clavata]|uniref:Uncharacterized protein n=1 Tax=Trichonephila clavata TaxID=2740835 RepID=A0A8X6JGI8_TRICU|nr:hypothetical protein TNCT_472811 [Trichonephila clavata]
MPPIEGVLEVANKNLLQRDRQSCFFRLQGSEIKISALVPDRGSTVAGTMLPHHFYQKLQENECSGA